MRNALFLLAEDETGVVLKGFFQTPRKRYAKTWLAMDLVIVLSDAWIFQRCDFCSFPSLLGDIKRLQHVKIGSDRLHNPATDMNQLMCDKP